MSFEKNDLQRHDREMHENQNALFFFFVDQLHHLIDLQYASHDLEKCFRVKKIITFVEFWSI
jgi:hypothetical protein